MILATGKYFFSKKKNKSKEQISNFIVLNIKSQSVTVFEQKLRGNLENGTKSAKFCA